MSELEAEIEEQGARRSPRKHGRKEQFRFSAKDDIALLKETISLFPHGEPHGLMGKAWETICVNFKRHCHQVGKKAEAPTSAGLKRRIGELLKQWAKEEIQSLRKSGTDEDFEEKEMLLTDLSEMMENIDQKRAQKGIKG
jgi:hypothetical protein